MLSPMGSLTAFAAYYSSRYNTDGTGYSVIDVDSNGVTEMRDLVLLTRSVLGQTASFT